MRADWNTLTDTQKLWALLTEAEAVGVHSHDLRSQGVSGNPSSRSKDLTSKGFQVYKLSERRGKRPGVRFFLDGWQPEEAVPVIPNHGADLGSGDTDPSTGPVAAELSAEVVWIRDYTDEGDRLGWREMAA